VAGIVFAVLFVVALALLAEVVGVDLDTQTVMDNLSGSGSTAALVDLYMVPFAGIAVPQRFPRGGGAHLERQLLRADRAAPVDGRHWLRLLRLHPEAPQAAASLARVTLAASSCRLRRCRKRWPSSPSG
jgi:hypothetical protein